MNRNNLKWHSELSQEFLDSTQKFYKADLMPVDFIGASAASRGQINQWVEEQTSGETTCVNLGFNLTCHYLPTKVFKSQSKFIF